MLVSLATALLTNWEPTHRNQVEMTSQDTANLCQSSFEFRDVSEIFHRSINLRSLCSINSSRKISSGLYFQIYSASVYFRSRSTQVWLLQCQFSSCDEVTHFAHIYLISCLLEKWTLIVLFCQSLCLKKKHCWKYLDSHETPGKESLH